MGIIPIEAKNRLVQRLARELDAPRAVVELVWNAIDAEAHRVEVTIERGPADHIDRLTIEDDGHGITQDEIDSVFRETGESWKSRTRLSKNGLRQLHGKKGEGRLRAFALGEHVSWATRTVGIEGKREALVVTGRRGDRSTFTWNSVEVTHQSDPRTGTTFTAENTGQRSLASLEKLELALLDEFAPILRADGSFDLILNEKKLTWQDHVADSVDIPLTVEYRGKVVAASLAIVEWRGGNQRELMFQENQTGKTYSVDCRDIGVPFPYAAQVSAEFENQGVRVGQLQLGDIAGGIDAEVWKSARKSLEDHFDTRRARIRQERLGEWKKQEIYPYSGTPGSPAERAEREIFDFIAGAISPHVALPKSSAHLTLVLLRDAVKNAPNRITRLLSEVMRLSDYDQEVLFDLLQETTLPGIVRSANAVTKRNEFIHALNAVLFDPRINDEVKERDHLHVLLERELWIFGEQYNMMSSERSLTELARNHYRLLGLPDKTVTPVERWDHRSGRTDLHLAVQARDHSQVRHLIVELKAPGVVIGRKELDQVEDYGNAIFEDPQFQVGNSEWELILVGTKIDRVAKNRIHPDGHSLGKFWAPADPPPDSPRVTAYVRLWADIIEENKARIDFYVKALQHDPSITESLAAVRRRHGDAMPSGDESTQSVAT